MQSESANEFRDPMNQGDHLCCIFESNEEFADLLTYCLKNALISSEMVLILTATKTEEEILRIIKSGGIELSGSDLAERLSIRNVADVFVTDGEFKPDETIQIFKLETERAIESGHKALRIICEVPPIHRMGSNPAKLVEYEAKLDRLLTCSKCIAVCLYDRRIFKADILLEVLHAHPILVTGNKAHNNPCYIPSADLLGDEVPETILLNYMANLSSISQKEEELENYRERLRAMSSATFEGILLHDNGIIVAANDAMSSMFGYELSELIGTSAFNFLMPEDVDIARNNITKGYELPYEVRGIRKNGAVFPIEIRGKSLVYGGRNLRVTAVRDISEHKKVLDALQRSEIRFRELADFLPETIFEMDASTQLTFANEAGTNLFGYILDDTRNGFGPLDLIAPEDRERAAKELAQVLDGRHLGGNEYIGLKKNGERVPILIHAVPIMEGTECRGARGIIVDLSEQKRAEQALRESEEKYRSIFENISDVYYETSLDGIILEVSPSVERLSSYRREDLIGKPLTEIYFDPDKREDLLESLERSGKVDDYELTLLDSNGTRIFCSLSSSIVFDEMGRPKKIIGTIRNVGERKQVEEEIRRKNAELRHALSVKSEFLSMVSHELRTPLVPIIGYSELLLGNSMGPLNDEAREACKVIYGRAEALSALIEDLLQLSQMDRGVLKVHPVSVKLRECVLELIESYPEKLHDGALELIKSYRDISQSKDVSIEWEGDECEVQADPVRLRQVLRNLIGNAVKYSRDSVAIRISGKVLDEYCEISVEDNGLGIAAEHLPYVFDRFYQVENVDTRVHEGTGLGLAISKELVELMGGYIFAESRYGEGSTFTIGLPKPVRSGETVEEAMSVEEIDEGSFDPMPEIMDPTADRIRVLVIDDDMFTQTLLDKMLSGRYEILGAMSGDEGLKIIESTQVDLILLDWMMPGIDGLSLLIKLKADDTMKDIPVVFISGKAEQESVDRAIDAGAVDFVTKPFNRDDLILRIEKAKAEIKCKPPVNA